MLRRWLDLTPRPRHYNGSGFDCGWFTRCAVATAGGSISAFVLGAWPWGIALAAATIIIGREAFLHYRAGN
jgi:hypothetical protein